MALELETEQRAEPDAIAPYPTWRLTVDQYHQMIDSGILTEDDPVELLEGWLVVKLPKKPRHRIATRKAQRTLEKVVPSGWYVDAQEPISTADSEPEPDISVVRGATEDYPDRHPGPGDVGLVGEIADRSLPRDRRWKKRLYAEARLPIYWIFNLTKRQIEVYAVPTGRGKRATYAKRRVYGENSSIPLVLEGKQVALIPVCDLLP
jgi:Uma2 family endonuclease